MASTVHGDPYSAERAVTRLTWFRSEPTGSTVHHERARSTEPSDADGVDAAERPQS